MKAKPLNTESNVTRLPQAHSVVTQINNHANVITADLDALAAIADCAKVLTALERATGENGEGMAAGYTLCDDSLPNLLHHALTLVDLAKNEADLMREKAVTALRAAERGRTPAEQKGGAA